MSTILLSINTYTNKYTKKQIESIDQFCMFDSITIVYNLDPKYDETDLIKFQNSFQNSKIKIIINPERIKKKRFHGSIVQGIFSNLLHMSNQNFDYVMILSERCIFFDYLTLDDMSILKPLEPTHKYTHLTHSSVESTNYPNKWHWKRFTNNNIYKKALDKGGVFGGLHEALTIDGYSYKKLINFIQTFDISDIYLLNACAEEFVPYSIIFLVDGKIANFLYHMEYDLKHKTSRQLCGCQPNIVHKTCVKKIK
tara:strand:+ start:412 stop:1170 length:759 start_codon:yes stop_codon:yes gene_type:complete